MNTKTVIYTLCILSQLTKQETSLFGTEDKLKQADQFKYSSFKLIERNPNIVFDYLDSYCTNKTNTSKDNVICK